MAGEIGALLFKIIDIIKSKTFLDTRQYIHTIYKNTPLEAIVAILTGCSCISAILGLLQ